MLITSVRFLGNVISSDVSPFLAQSTVDDVEGLFRRHADFEKKLKAHDDKVRALDELADKLVAENHPDSDRYDTYLSPGIYCIA